MLQRTLQRLTFNRLAKEQTRCEVSHTLLGGYCEKPGTQRTIDGLLCEQHARQVGLEERIACWEAILLHTELWSKIARRRGRATGDSPKGLDITNVDEASPQLYCSFILKLGESPGYSLPVSSDHGAQTLVGVVLGYLDILTSHYPLSFTEKEDEIRQTGRNFL